MERKISNDLKEYGRIAQEFGGSMERYNNGELNIAEAGSHYEFHLFKLMELRDRIKQRKPHYHELIEILKIRILAEWKKLNQEYERVKERVT